MAGALLRANQLSALVSNRNGPEAGSITRVCGEKPAPESRRPEGQSPPPCIGKRPCGSFQGSLFGVPLRLRVAVRLRLLRKSPCSDVPGVNAQSSLAAGACQPAVSE